MEREEKYNVTKHKSSCSDDLSQKGIKAIVDLSFFSCHLAATMGLDFNITLHLHYGGKFEEIDEFIQYVGETGCRQIEHDCDKLSLPELGSILKEDCRYEGDVRELVLGKMKVAHLHQQ